MKRHDLLGITMILLFLIALRLGNIFFVWFALLLLAIFYGTRWWLLYVARHVTGAIQLETKRLFLGESTNGELILENRGLFPVFGIQVKFEYWNECPIESPYLQISDNDRILIKSSLTPYRGSFSLGKRQKMNIPMMITCKKRGSYAFKSITLEIKDPFGIDKLEKQVDLFEEVLVYPNEIDLQGLDQTHRIPQGESVVKRWILDDIFFPVGARPYQPGDPFNRIDFKSTAKLKELHTKKYDFTAHGDICVIGNLHTSSYKWVFDEDHFERTLSIVSRLARESLSKDLRFSFYANAQAGKGMRVFEIPSSSGRIHFRKVLEVLSRFHLIHATPFPITIAKVRQRYPNGALAVVITSYLDETIRHELNLLAKQGFEVYVVDSSQEVPVLQNWSYIRWTKEAVSFG